MRAVHSFISCLYKAMSYKQVSVQATGSHSEGLRDRPMVVSIDKNQHCDVIRVTLLKGIR